MRNIGISAALLCAISAVQAAPAAGQLEPVILKAVQCSAQSSIWLQGATFKLESLKVEAADAQGNFPFSGEITAISPLAPKPEKSVMKGVAQPSLKLTSLSLTDEGGESREVKTNCFE